MKISVEQILQLALQQAEKEAPPAPSVEWFREQLAEHAAEPESKGERWWQKVWELLWLKKPELIPLAVGARRVEATGLMRPTQKSRTIPACVLREDHMDDASVEVTQPPVVNDEGNLIFNVLVRKMEGILDSGEKLELTLLAPPDGKPVGEPLDLYVEKEKTLTFELPPDLRKEWQDIERAWQNEKNWKWSNLPFRFALRPANETTEVLKGKAAGVQDDEHSENNCHHPQVATWAILLTLLLAPNPFYAFVFRYSNRYHIYNLAIQQEIDELRFSSFFTGVLPLLGLLGFESLKPLPYLSSSFAKRPTSARSYHQMNSHRWDYLRNKLANKQNLRIPLNSVTLGNF